MSGSGADVLWPRNQEHVRAFEYLRVCATCLHDNMKVVLTG